MESIKPNVHHGLTARLDYTFAKNDRPMLVHFDLDGTYRNTWPFNVLEWRVAHAFAAEYFDSGEP
jgi:hypothetical protein